METSLDKLLFGLFGWALGLLSTVAIDAYKRFVENREVRTSLRTELMELQYRLATMVMMLDMRLGRLDRALFVWLHPIFKRYEGVNPNEASLKTVETMLKASDQELASYAEAMKSPPDGGLGLKKVAAPLLESKFALVSSLDTKLQNRLMEIRVHLGLLNEEVEQARFYFNLTFSNGVSEENYERAVHNLRECYRYISERAKIVADHIAKIDWPTH